MPFLRRSLRLTPLALLTVLAGCGNFEKPPEWRDAGRDAYAVCDYKRAFEHFYERADSGIAEDQARVAVMYARGRYVELDRETGLMWAVLAKTRGQLLTDGLIASILDEVEETRRDPMLERAVARADAWLPRSQRENTETAIPAGKYDSYGRQDDCHLDDPPTDRGLDYQRSGTGG